MSCLERFFSCTPTPSQLSVFEKAINAPTSAVLIVAPTAFGKSVLADAFLDYYSSKLLKTTYLVPTNVLVDQFSRMFSRFKPMLSRKFHKCVYHDGKKLVYTDAAHCSKKCPKYGKPQYCEYIRSVQDYKEAFTSVTNYWMPFAHRIKNLDVVIVDEAHLWFDYFFATLNKVVFPNDLNYPHTYNVIELKAWAEAMLRSSKRNTTIYKNLKVLIDELSGYSDKYVISVEDFNEDGISRALVLYPKQVSDAFNAFVRGKKLICLSATISEKDLQKLGYAGNFTIIEAESPIPASRRPVHVMPFLNMSAKEDFPNIVQALRFIKHLHDTRPNENGFVHVTYKLSERFRLLMETPEFAEMRQYCMFHTVFDKIEQFNEFIKRRGSGFVFFGAGMYEGIDLKDDIARWQVIPKIAWSSMMSAVTLSYIEESSDNYDYITAQKLMQAAGRICRHPGDYGDTYILDRSFHMFSKTNFFKWFTDALVFHNNMFV